VKGSIVATFTGAFVVRCWQGRDDALRIEIVRIRDGERTVFTTIDDAYAWLRSQLTRSEPWRLDDRAAPKGGGET
jgi:hypothetical protein